MPRCPSTAARFPASVRWCRPLRGIRPRRCSRTRWLQVQRAHPQRHANDRRRPFPSNADGMGAYEYRGIIRRATTSAAPAHQPLRHATASFLVSGGRTLYEVRQILGHSNPIVTQRVRTSVVEVATRRGQHCIAGYGARRSTAAADAVGGGEFGGGRGGGPKGGLRGPTSPSDGHQARRSGARPLPHPHRRPGAGHHRDSWRASRST